MDACGVRPPGALLLRKSDPNGHDADDAAARRRPATPRRHPSPNAGRPSTPATTPRRHPSPNAAASGPQAKRSQSTERRSASPSRPASGGGGGGARAAAPPSRISAPTSPSSAPSSPTSSSSSSSTPVRDAVSETQSAPRRLSGGGGRAPDGLWPSMRNLSSSLQLESRAGRTSTSSSDQARTRDAPDRKRSPMIGRTASELPENPHAKMIDHHRWPAMMGGRVSGSAMSRSVDLTDRISNRPALSLILSRGGASPKRASGSSAADALSRSIDLADKIDRLVSSSRGESPRTSSASNGTADRDARPAALAIPWRGVSPVRTGGGIRALSKSMDLTEKDSSALFSAVSSSPGISPSASVSSVPNATSQPTKSSDRLNGRASSPASSRGRSPRTPASGGIGGAVSKNVDVPEKEKRPVSSRGSSPRRRLASDGVNAVVKNMDFAEKDSRTAVSSVPSRGVSPRRRLASDGIDAIPSTEFSEKDHRPSTSSSLRGVSPRKRLGSDGISKGLDFADKANTPSTSSTASRGTSPRTQLASDCAGTTSKHMDSADKDSNRPSTSYAASRGMSPRRRLASDGISSTSNNINFAEKDGRAVPSSVAYRGMSTIRRLASDGADTIPKDMDIPDKNVRPSTSAGSRGFSPRRRLASDGLNVISKSIDLSEKDTRPTTLSAASRGLSPRRRLASDTVEAISKSSVFVEKEIRPSTSSMASRGVSPRRRLASDNVEVISKSSDFVEKETRCSTSSLASRGVSPRRRLASDNVEVISKSSDFVEKETRSSASSVASRGVSPRRRLASDGVNNLLKSTDFSGNDCRPSTSAAPLRGTSPRSRVVSNSIHAPLRSMNLADKDNRPSTSSRASRVPLQRGGLAPGSVMDSVDKGNARSPSSSASGETSDSRLDGTDVQAEVVEFADEVNSVTPDGCSDETSESTHSGSVGTGTVSLSIAVQDRPPSRSVSDVSKDMSQNVDATQERSRVISVKIPSRGSSPRRRLASDGIDTIPKSMDFAEKEKRPITSSVPSRGMSPRRIARVDSANIMSKSMDFSDKCNGQISSIIPSRVVSTRKILGPDGANAMSRSVDLTDNKLPVSSTVQSCRISPRKMPSAYSRVKGPELSSGDVGSPGSADGNGSQEENSSSSPAAPSNNSEKFGPSKQLARTLSSPSRGLLRPSSPTKASSTSSFASRRLPSPLRIRPSTPVSPCSSGRSDSPSSILSYIGDATRGKKSPSHMEDTHQLRLLYNRNLQWRFTNAYVDEMLSIQKMGAETMLYSVWDSNTRMSDSMVTKRSYVQRLRQEVKLGIVLKEQMDYLDHWAVLETDHSTSLSGAIEALRASTLRLPVTGGAKADVLTVKNAVSSAVDIMQAMGSSVCNLLTKLQATHSLVTELSAVAAKESTTLNEYRELLATAAALQVHESSLRTQIIQQTE
ncbi:hypothetical protein ACQ4PT_001193 [Festuca glaucescens]